MTEALTDVKPVRLKGRSFLALVLAPELPFDDWLTRLDDLAARSTGFFMQRPIVLDVAGLEIDRAQLRDLIEQLGGRDVRVMGIEGADADLLGADIPPAISGGLPASDFKKPGTGSGAPEPVAPGPGTAGPPLMVTVPVRSGQSLISEGDITVVGSVSSGAEIVAGGSIHVYGTLRGRAIAGSAGNATARIFCRKLEAELVAIGGYYQTSEDIDPALRGRTAQFWLEDDAILAQAMK